MGELDPDCVFCKIIRKEIPSVAVFEDEELFCFQDANPQAPTHLLLIPKRHVTGIDVATWKDADWLGRMLALVPSLAARTGIRKEGYRVVVNSGRAGGQTVFHLHLHLLGGRNMTWPPG
ncbi:MAG: histidine triad nucleotide-binding protein [Planctomycetes bacterium]|nr:histidine triad nucleotide-binding protein [Planctomycetota bacterium]